MSDAAAHPSYGRAMPELFFEDFSAGAGGEIGPHLVTREEIIAFAREFDPQPFHLDEEAARHTFVGELIASGWHSCALAMRIMLYGLMAPFAAALSGEAGARDAGKLRLEGKDYVVADGDVLHFRFAN